MIEGYASMPTLNDGGEFKIDEEIVERLRVEQEEQALKEESLRAVLATQEDPTQQDYIQRLDRKTLIKSDEEFSRCLKHSIPMRRVAYTHAIQIMKENEAAHRNKIKKRRKNKVARSSRKANRA